MAEGTTSWNADETERQKALTMSGSSGGLMDTPLPSGGLKRCGGGMSSPSLAGGGIPPLSGGLPRTRSACALRIRSKKAVFWEQCFESPSKRDL